MVGRMGVGLLLAAVLVAQVSAESGPREVACPNQAELEAELARAGAGGVPTPDLEVDGHRMRVALWGRDGALLGSREVEAPASCGERATVAAVLVATWMGIWPASPTPTRAAVPLGEPVLPATPSAIEVPRAASPPARTLELGLQVGGAHDGSGAALAGAVELRRTVTGPLRIVFAASGTSERDRKIGDAHAGYLRPAIELGSAVRVGRGSLQGEIGASARLGLLFVRGKALAIAHRVSHPVPGAAASVRLVLAREQLSPFLAAGFGYWFAGQRLTLDDDGATAQLPRWDVSASLGLLWSP